MRTIGPTTRIYLARSLRDFADGFVALLLPVYLAARGFDAFQIGLTATLALLGSALTTLAIGLVGARFGQRSLLLFASALMATTGIAFASSDVVGLVLLIAFFGTINPSAGTVSILVPLEHAVLARTVADSGRTRAFAIYSLVGALAAAVGALLVGSPALLQRAGLSELGALQAMFELYALLGVAAGLIYAGLPRDAPVADAAGVMPPVTALGPSRGIVLKLAALFSVDAFAGGFVVQSLLALWLFNTHGLSLASAGTFFFVAGLLAASSQPASSTRWSGCISRPTSR